MSSTTMETQSTQSSAPEPTPVAGPMGAVCLTEAEGATCEVPIEVLKKSVFLQGMIEDLGDDCGPDNPIPVPNIPSQAVWDKFVEYANYMCQSDYPTDKRTGKIDEYTDREREFVASLEIPLLFDVIKAANFLDCKPLLEVTCKAVAEKIKGKTPEEIRQLFGIKNDFTPEEEAQVKSENAWMDASSDVPASGADDEN